MIKLTKQRDSQPQEAAEVNWSNPISRRLAMLYAPSVHVDAVTGRLPAGVNPALAPTPRGLGAVADSSATRLWANITDANWSQVSVFALLIPSVTDYQLTHLAGVGKAFVSRLQFGVYPGGGNLLVDRNGGWGSARPYLPGKVNAVAIRHDSVANLAAYRVNGSAAVTSDAAAPSFTGAQDIGVLINVNSNAASEGGTVVLSAMWQRALSDAEFDALFSDPWQLFAAQRIWVPVSTTSSGNYTVNADSGTYSVTGQTATLLRNKVVSADYGTYSVSGQTASIYRNKVLSASHGTYSVSGQNASLFKTRIVTAEFGSYSVTGQNATISYTPTGGYTLVAEKGDYTYTGQTATLLRSKVVNALNGTYSVTGQNATLSYSGSNTITLKAGSWLRYRIIQ